ncbi:thymidylate kinase [Elsinoe ampelina]|uniref:Thymidylate kinase n=1 Tax=Elsinoe ampelina TaxID=302913 RepID=A0A6A6G4K2_9PEZI|nr:thymidylate kinase [Elsinoe ampelina]
MARGKLIVLEGLDRAGKSTQCSKLVERLSSTGQKIKHVKFPDRTTPIGTMIDNYLRGENQQEDHVIHLLFSANRWEAAASIEEAILSGTSVVVDRYIYSGCVYSAAKQNPTLSLRWARHPEEGLPRPDICVFLEITPEEAAKRGGWGEERYEKKELQDRVRQLFTEMKSTPDGEDFVTIDAGRSFDDVERSIWDAVEAACKNVDEQNLPLRRIQGI